MAMTRAIDTATPYLLDRLPRGRKARVVDLRVGGLTRRRLLDLGLGPGAEVEAVMVSPLGDPVAYRVRGAMIALRREDAAGIVVEPLAGSEN